MNYQTGNGDEEPLTTAEVAYGVAFTAFFMWLIVTLIWWGVETATCREGAPRWSYLACPSLESILERQRDFIGRFRLREPDQDAP